LKTQYQLSGDLSLAAFIELTGTTFFFSKSFSKELAKTSLGSFEKSNDKDFKWIKPEAALQDENNTMGDNMIDYIVPGNGIVEISLINPLSQCVQLFFSGNQSKGQYQLILPNKMGSLLPGNYFIRWGQNDQLYYSSFFKQ
jgi:hypothetical protein